MTDWTTVSRTAHAEHGYLPRQGYHHAANQAVMPILLAELPKLMPYYMIGFHQDDDGLMPVVVLGVAKGQNLYLHPDGRWLAAYMPAALRGHPFTLTTNSPDDPRDSKSLAIARDYLVEEGGKPLFQGGELAKPVADTLEFLNQCERGRQVTRKATQALLDAGVLISWPLSVPIDGERKQVTGLYRVDEKQLETLDDPAYLRLKGLPMQLAYGQLYSTSQGHQLIQRAALHERLANEQTPENLDEVFGEDNDDLMFDFND